MARIRNLLALWRRKWQEWREAARTAREDADGSDSVDLDALREVADANPVKRTVNMLLWEAWTHDVAQWSISADGPSFDFDQLRQAEQARLARNLRALAVHDPLLTEADLPAGFDPQSVRTWMATLESRTLEKRDNAGRALALCRSYLSQLDNLSNLQACAPGLWPRIRNRLWVMSNGAEGVPSWRLPPDDATCHGRIALILGGKPVTVHVAYAPDRIDIRLVPDKPETPAMASPVP